MSYHRNYYTPREIAFNAYVDAMNAVSRADEKERIQKRITEFNLGAEQHVSEALFRLNEASKPEIRTDSLSASVAYGRTAGEGFRSSKPKSVHIGVACSIALLIMMATYLVNF